MVIATSTVFALEVPVNNPHQNARTTFYSRALIVQRVLKEGKSVKEVAEALGVSRRTVYKWLARYKSGGQ
ncbi:MAG: helix-turn-helix domain-containing protein, partial [Proteobacteria bacterium]|nr:helix-turn-helix domain-containing protein [Pseudomonadota bacterium]MBU4385353.1 helix-turn-helix domain-containing protein [Pseudomonadota bacterium]